MDIRYDCWIDPGDLAKALDDLERTILCVVDDLFWAGGTGNNAVVCMTVGEIVKEIVEGADEPERWFYGESAQVVATKLGELVHEQVDVIFLDRNGEVCKTNVITGAFLPDKESVEKGVLVVYDTLLTMDVLVRRNDAECGQLR